jgi:hypothetical protein
VLSKSLLLRDPEGDLERILWGFLFWDSVERCMGASPWYIS